MARLIIIPLAIAVVLYAILDCARTPATDMPGRLPKALWVLAIIILPGIGAVAWLILSRLNRETQARARGETGPRGLWSSPARPAPEPTRRSGAPDDDPEFLRRLAMEQRRARRDQLRRDQESAPSADEDAPSDDAEADVDRRAEGSRDPAGDLNIDGMNLDDLNLGDDAGPLLDRPDDDDGSTDSADQSEHNDGDRPHN